MWYAANLFMLSVYCSDLSVISSQFPSLSSIKTLLDANTYKVPVHPGNTKEKIIMLPGQEMSVTL